MSSNYIHLGRETADDWWEIEALYDLTFAPGRSALSSYRLREGVAALPDLCLVARDPARVIAGVVRNWPVRVGGHATVLLGPIAVHPTRQGEGIAAMLMWRSLEIATQNWDRIMLVGDAPFYQRYGFERLQNVQMPPPTNPDRVLGLAVTPGGWDQVLGKVCRIEP